MEELKGQRCSTSHHSDHRTGWEDGTSQAQAVQTAKLSVCVVPPLTLQPSPIDPTERMVGRSSLSLLRSPPHSLHIFSR